MSVQFKNNSAKVKATMNEKDVYKRQVYYYVQDGNGNITEDTSEKINPKPHILYQKKDDKAVYFKNFGCIPFFRLDNNKKRCV